MNAVDVDPHARIARVQGGATLGPEDTMGQTITAGDVELYAEQRGQGPDVLLVGGLTDPVETWEPQLAELSDRYRVTAFDNRGAGRSPDPPDGFDVAGMADDAAGVMRALDVPVAHVMGLSGGSFIAQELALRHPDLVRSLVLTSTMARLDAYAESMVRFWNWLVDNAPSEREMLEAFFLWIYTPRAHENGLVEELIEEAMAFEHAQSAVSFQAQLAAFARHDTYDRLPDISVPTLVVSGELDIALPPRHGAIVAERIPGAEFVVLEGEAHQPFQENPEAFNARADAFWRRVDQ
jgi:pimeloyl-ACP methyl ester carboxylesterase